MRNTGWQQAYENYMFEMKEFLEEMVNGIKVQLDPSQVGDEIFDARPPKSTEESVTWEYTLVNQAGWYLSKNEEGWILDKENCYWTPNRDELAGWIEELEYELSRQQYAVWWLGDISAQKKLLPKIVRRKVTVSTVTNTHYGVPEIDN